MHRLVLLLALVACQTKQDKAPDPAPPAAPAPAAEPAKPPPPPAPAVDLAGFDTACKEATDCVLVKAAGCDPCACAVDAIASREMAKFDDAAAKLACPPPDLDRQMACGGCEPKKAACTAGRCALATTP